MPRKQHNPFLDFLNTGNRFTQLLCSFATARNYRYLNLSFPFESLYGRKTNYIFQGFK